MVVALGEGGQVVVGVQNCDAQLFKKKKHDRNFQKFHFLEHTKMFSRKCYNHRVIILNRGSMFAFQ